MQEAPFSCQLRLLRNQDVRRYGCSGETTGGTGREGIRNIFRDGDSRWNKWYDPAYDGAFPRYAQVTLEESLEVVGYGIKSANDVPWRDPASWQLMLGRDNGNIVREVHSVSGHRFDRRYETHLFVVSAAGNVTTQTDLVRLNITEVNSLQSGTQFAQLYVIVKQQEAEEQNARQRKRRRRRNRGKKRKPAGGSSSGGNFSLGRLWRW
ncbi:expressed unknown protein [Seminavis robusta]|uniref:Uncharacterized protein n=1 Tax=Seminavis robusta TaxID=568900 RepID=A0A9N8EZ13_9STRA|nr:expressed unknown protein [Seminavis robusta]|eukprot:Sro2361_g324770.1 n/a (208) ;mRNA; r:2797-3420